MHRLQNAAHSAARHFASIILLLLASHGSALSQGASAPVGCDKDVSAAAPVTDAVVALAPKRGWQMVGRNIELTLTSSKLTADTKPLVCFRWKRNDGKGPFAQANSVRVSQRSQTNQQRSADQPPSITLAVPVPEIKVEKWPEFPNPAYFFTEDPATAIAEVRILLLGADGQPPLADILTTLAIVGENDYCNVPRDQRTDVGTVSTSKNWQPVHGTIEFVAKSFAPIPADIAIRTCFRWKLKNQNLFNPYSDSENNRVLDRQSGTSTLKLAVTVPDIGNEPGRILGDRVGYFGVPFLLMPKVDVRLLFFDNNLDPVLDARTEAWITSLLFGLAMASVVVAAAFLALWLVCRRRFTGKTNPLLCLITTRNGFASLSQFQIMLWTFLVIASAAYVMALSGALIPITNGTLVLLGISGAAAIIAKAKSESDASAAPAPLDTAAAKREAARAEDDATKAEAAARRIVGDERAEAELAAKEAAAKATAANAKVEAAEASLAAANARAAIATAVDKLKAEAEALAELDNRVGVPHPARYVSVRPIGQVRRDARVVLVFPSGGATSLAGAIAGRPALSIHSVGQSEELSPSRDARALSLRELESNPVLDVRPGPKRIRLELPWGSWSELVNADPTPYDVTADAVLRGSISDVLPELVRPLRP